MNKLAFVLAPLTVTLLIGCGRDTVSSNKIAPSHDASGGTISNNIDRDYLLSYEEDSGRVSLLAQFTMAGTWNTTVRLDPPASIAVDGSRLRETEPLSQGGATALGLFFPIFSPIFWAVSGTSYHADLAGSYNSTHMIHWVDQLGKAFDDQIRVYSFSSNLPPMISLASGASISCFGESAPGETTYAASLTRRRDGRSIVSKVNGTGSSVTIRADDLREFQPGSLDLKLERTVRIPLNQNGSGSATANLVYQSRTYPVSVQ